MARFFEHPSEHVVNVQWGGLWLGLYVFISTGSNVIAPDGDASGSLDIDSTAVGGDILGAGFDNGHVITAEDIASGNFVVSAEFIDVDPGTSDSIQGIRFIKVPATGDILTGLVSGEYSLQSLNGVSSGSLRASLFKSSLIHVGKIILMLNNSDGIPDIHTAQNQIALDIVEVAQNETRTGTITINPRLKTISLS